MIFLIFVKDFLTNYGDNKMYKVVLLRHGESEWNKLNLFTGWTDVDLSEKGIQEAHQAGITMKAEGYIFDIAFTSVLKEQLKLFTLPRKKWI